MVVVWWHFPIVIPLQVRQLCTALPWIMAITHFIFKIEKRLEKLTKYIIGIVSHLETFSKFYRHTAFEIVRNLTIFWLLAAGLISLDLLVLNFIGLYTKIEPSTKFNYIFHFLCLGLVLVKHIYQWTILRGYSILITWLSLE